MAALAVILWVTGGAWIAAASGADAHPRSAAAASDNSPRTHIDEELARRLYNEAPQAWARLRERMETQRGSYSISTSGAGVSRRRRSRRVDYAIDGENMKAAFQRDEVDVVFGGNEDYAFSISRRAGDENADYAIQWLEQRGQDPEIEAEIKSNAHEYCQSANASWNFMGIGEGKLFSEWFDEPGFTVHGVAADDSTGEDLVRVDFSYAPPPSASTNRVGEIPSAYILFDPAHDWIFREFKIFRPWGVNHTIFEYAEPVDGIPMLTERRAIIKGDDGSTMEVVETIDGLTIEPTPAEEFRLPFYGLPEPNFERPWYGSWLIYVIGGAACLAAAYALRRRRQAAV